MIKKIKYFVLFLIIIIAGCSKDDTNNTSEVPIWHGFNLLGKYTVEWSNTGYSESDFELMQTFGFNYARLPIDYRTYTIDGNWLVFDENGLANIDQAVEWGKKYGIHICISLHRAPGFCVNPPSEPLSTEENRDLWTDTIAQRVFYRHWEMFASRYKNIPSSDLSFNLVNEPFNVSAETYVQIVKNCISAIRKYNSERIIVVDGLGYAREPVYELTGENIIQSFHMYDPLSVTHYKASWISGSGSWPVPVWPLHPFSKYLYGSYKQQYKSPLIISGNFQAKTRFTIRVQQVSVLSNLVAKDDRGTELLNKRFEPADGEGEWTEVVETEWGYQNIYNKDYSFDLINNTDSVIIENTIGDWLIISSISIKPETDTIVLNPMYTDWGAMQNELVVHDDGAVTDADGENKKFTLIDSWIEFSESKSVNIIVGEWGVYNQTPHDVTLTFMEEQLQIYKKYNVSWSLWNFTGGFGIINSDRKDVNYEVYDDKKLDRTMLTLLQKYN